MSAAWLSQPVELHSSRAFDCEDLTAAQCAYYKQPWHFWYMSDLRFGLSTIAFFMVAIGIFIISRVLCQLIVLRKSDRYLMWRRLLATVRYLSYRGFRIPALHWSSAPLGVLILGTAGTIFFFCMDLAPQPYYWPSEIFGNSPPLATRSGWMALACMPFIFATASKANWITLLTGVTHEKLQVFHRWIAYAFFLLALLHTFPFIVYHIRSGDMVAQVTESNTLFYWTGIVALIFQAWLTFASFGPLRNVLVGYEFFKTTHFVAAAIFVVVFFWHCDYTLTSWDYFIATAGVYVPCLLYSQVRTYFEYGFNQKAEVFVEGNGFIRLVIPSKAQWMPGQHCFLRFRKFGAHALTSHPFTICSLPSTSPDKNSKMVFYIRHQTGLTAKIYDYALTNPGASIPVFVDGPYGGIDPRKYSESDRLLVVAGGSGAGWTLPFIEQHARRTISREYQLQTLRPKENENEKERQANPDRSQKTSARPSSLFVILATRDTATQLWYESAVAELLSDYSHLHSSSNLDVEIHLTREAREDSSLPTTDVDLEGQFCHEKLKTQAQQTYRASVTRKELHGRPNLPLIIQEETMKIAERGQSLGVFVCGPDEMSEDVRNAVAKENLRMVKHPRAGGVYLHQEHFSWA